MVVPMDAANTGYVGMELLSKCEVVVAGVNRSMPLPHVKGRRTNTFMMQKLITFCFIYYTNLT